MAWYKRYGIPFKSRLGTQYMVFISTQTDGSLTRLKGAAEPFTTEENKDDDIFTPMRGQTGTLRVIDETNDGSLLSSLIPQNNTEKLVQLYTVTWNDTSFSSYSLGTLCWQGFLCSQAFTQPWHDNKKVIEIPVKSLLSALEDVSLSASDAGGSMRIATLIVKAFQALNVLPDYFYLEHTINASALSSYFWAYKIQAEALFTQEDNTEEGQSTFSWVGLSYYDAIAAILRFYGLTARENASTIYFTMYDKVDAKITSWHFTWEAVKNISDHGSTLHWPSNSVPSDRILLANVNFMGSDNTEEFVQGARRASVSLPLKSYNVHMNLPLTVEDSTTPTEVTVDNPTVAVQPHEPRSNNIETFKYLEYSGDKSITSNPQDTIVGDSTYAACLNNSVINNNTGWISENTITGAFPCRWYHADGVSSPLLKNGLFLNQRYMRYDTSYNNDICYALYSSLSYKLSNGYLQIRFNNYNFDQGYIGTASHPNAPGTPHFGKWTGLVPSPDAMQTDIYVCIRFGSKYWNQSSGKWESFSSVSAASFTPISFDNNGIMSNKTSDMHISETEGFFIPIVGSLSGKIYLYIADIASHREGQTYRFVHSRIITDLSVQFLPDIATVASTRTENVYRRTILQSGFQSDKAVNLVVGTNNNNTPSPVFLQNGSNNYFESLEYVKANNTAFAMRPEIYLLSRMAAHYATVRRNYTGIIQSGVSLLSSAFSYRSKRFFGIDAKHDWKNDAQEVKFIEVS